MALIEGLAGSGSRPLLHTSGSSVIADNARGDYASNQIFEDDSLFTPIPDKAHRAAIDQRVRDAASILEGDLIAALERQDLACIGRCCDFESQTFDNLPGAMHLNGVAGCQFAWSDPYAILQSHAYVATHRSGQGGDRKLLASGAQDRPAVVPPK